MIRSKVANRYKLCRKRCRLNLRIHTLKTNAYIHSNVRTGDALLIATEKLKQSGLIYSLRLDMVINRLRFAKILSIANKLFGATGVAVLEELAVHGRYSIIYFTFCTLLWLI